MKLLWLLDLLPRTRGWNHLRVGGGVCKPRMKRGKFSRAARLGFYLLFRLSLGEIEARCEIRLRARAWNTHVRIACCIVDSGMRIRISGYQVSLMKGYMLIGIRETSTQATDRLLLHTASLPLVH